MEETATNTARTSIPYDPQYDVPLRIWDQHGRDIVDYGTCMHTGAIHAVRRDRNPVEIRFFLQEVSNFRLSILLHFEREKGSTFLLEFTDREGRVRRVECSTDELATLTRFKKLCLRLGNYHFTGGIKDFKGLVALLLDSMAPGERIDRMGYHSGTRSFIFCNAAVGDKVVEFDKYGCFEVDGKNYYVPACNINGTKKLDSVLSRARSVRYVDNGPDFRSWADQVVTVHGDAGMVAICFALATAFSDHIFELEGGFPLLYLYAEPGSGSTSLMRSIQAMFGQPLPDIILTGKANTDKGKMRMFAEHVNMPICVAEYHSELPAETFELLKGIWDRIGYKCGDLSNRFGIETVPIHSTAILTGKDYPNSDMDLFSRLMVVEMVGNSFNAQRRTEYSRLKAMIDAGCSGIMQELMQHRTELEKLYAQYSKNVHAQIDHAFNRNRYSERKLKGIQILGAVYQFFARRLQFPFTYEQLMDHLDCRVDQGAKPGTAQD